MPKALIITEKPSVARDIVDALGGFTGHDNEYWESDRYLCTFAIGHVLEFLEPEEIDAVYKRWTLNNLPIIPDEFRLKPKEGHTGRIRLIQKLMNRADVDRLINACDAGREGELIFRELVKYAGVSKPIWRLWLQSMTPQAIRSGFQSLLDGRQFNGLGAAAECRSMADWLIGMNATRAMTIRMRSRSQPGAWSVGRVQTPTLALLVERELEILAHIPEPYWRVLGTFTTDNQVYQGTWYDPQFRADESKPQLEADRIFDLTRAEAIVAEVLDQPGLASETRRPSRESAPPLFDLTSLQREANRRFGMSAQRTLSAAQRCYEQHKVLTYPRTDSRCLPSDYVAHVENVLRVFARGGVYQASADYLLRNGRQNDNKIFNDAGVSDHFAIIPTGQTSHLSGDDQRVFDLVVRRFLSAFYPPAVWEQVERKTIVVGNTFRSRARTLRDPGWRAVYEQEATAEDEGRGLAPLIPGQDKADNVSVHTNQAQADEDVTKPPPRITEARLLSLMENAGKQIDDENLAAVLSGKGLGTPATRAEIIEGLKSKGFVDQNLRPQVKGMRLIDLLRRIHTERLTSAELTGEIELHLREVERGDRPAQTFLSEITDYTREIVDRACNFDYDEVYPNEHPLGTCPCDQKRVMYERSWFYRCEEDPSTVGTDRECPFRIWKENRGRYIDRKTVEILLRDGKTGEVDGFTDRQGRTYKAVLTVENKEVMVRPVAAVTNGGAEGAETVSPEQAFPVNEEPLGSCPIHKNGCLVVETPTAFVCQTFLKQQADGARKPEGLFLPRMVCKRAMTREEAVQFMETGATPLIEDFISKRNRPFKATLKIRADGRHSFEFPPREGGAGGAGGGRRGGFRKKVATNGEDATDNTNAPVEEAPATGKTKRKTTVKKAVAAKPAPKKTTTKKAPAKRPATKKSTRKGTQESS